MYEKRKEQTLNIGEERKRNQNKKDTNGGISERGRCKEVKRRTGQADDEGRKGTQDSYKKGRRRERERGESIRQT